MPDNIAIDPFKFEGILIENAITHRIFHKDAERQKKLSLNLVKKN